MATPTFRHDDLIRPLAPLEAVWREPEVLQVGSAPCVRIAGPPRLLTRLALLLNVPRTLDELGRAIPGMEPAELHRVVEALLSAGLVALGPPPQPTLIQVIGGELAGAVCEALGEGLVTTGVRQTSDPDLNADHLFVVASDRCEPDRGLTDTLLRAGRTHLIVRVGGGRGRVGPLVVPGRTPCLRCEDLALAAADPRWAQLAAQLARVPGLADVLVRRWAITTACLQVRAHVAGRRSDAEGRVLELGVLDDALRAAQLRPALGCHCRAVSVGTMAG